VFPFLSVVFKRGDCIIQKIKIIDTSKGYIVTIKDEYYRDGKSIMINEQKTIKTK